jgi:hypothetical protein
VDDLLDPQDEVGDEESQEAGSQEAPGAARAIVRPM